MNEMSLEEYEKTEGYKKFILENPAIGILKVQVFTADQAIPIANAKVSISKVIDQDQVLFFEGLTNDSGIIDNIKLPAPGGEYNTETFEIPKYTTYQLNVSNGDYHTDKKYEVAMFGDIKVLQYIKMLPNNVGGIY